VPQIILGPGLEKLDGSLQKATYAFLAKLSKSDQTAGLHIEPINNSADNRARTGRVDISNRAVLFKLQGSNQDASYVFIGTYPHDEAIEIAQKSRLKMNPRNNIAELIPVDEAESAAAPKPTIPAPAVVQPSVSKSAQKSLREREYTVDDLTDLGIAPEFAENALDIADPDDLLEYTSNAPATWQANALLDVFTGESLTEIRKKYQISNTEPEGETEDDRMLAALRHPAAQMEFAFIEDDDALRAAIENPNFAAWRIFLHPEQRVFTTRDFNGPARITGGAGTGKTVVLLHRTRALHRKNPQARIVLTTYNRTLADSLKTQLQLLDSSIPIASHLGEPGVYIAGIDSIAYQLLASAGDLGGSDGKPGPVADVLGPRTSRVLDRTRDDEWRYAAEENGGDLPAELRTTSFLEAEYATIVLPERITTEQQYLKVRRPGRGVSLNRQRRKEVWGIIAAYRAASAAAATTDYEERAAIAARHLEDRGPIADHVLVDEAQDLSPARFQLLRALVAPGQNDLFIAEDGHQRIYGQKFVLGHFGIKIVGRSSRLTLNYRTTEQNLRYALGILSGAEFADLNGEADTTANYRSARSGPHPKAEPVKSLAEQYDRVAKYVQDWLDKSIDPESIGLLVPTKNEGQQLVRALGDRGVSASYVDRDTSGKRSTPQVMTMHRAKGMEFAKVILVGASASNLPRNYIIDALPEGDREDALQRERSLLYVAATRARDELVVVWVGEPSELLPTGAAGSS